VTATVLEGILIGVVVVALQTAYAEFRDRIKERKRTRGQRTKAYVRLYAILERFGVNPSVTILNLPDEDYKELVSAVEENYDVLYQDTLKEWRNRIVKRVLLPQGQSAIRIEAGTFFGEVRVHYERLDKRNPYQNVDKDTEKT
jgi:MFS superfamily sulfate permease-like transporter